VRREMLGWRGRVVSGPGAGVGMEFAVLGRLAARSDDVDVGLGSFKQRSLLALLLIHANEVVATDRIIDELWGDDPVSDRQNALWVHVSNLRSELEPAREKRPKARCC
jgi:DNA-binding response OmpR family regulator